jgi:hypothetical protein
MPALRASVPAHRLAGAALAEGGCRNAPGNGLQSARCRSPHRGAPGFFLWESDPLLAPEPGPAAD